MGLTKLLSAKVLGIVLMVDAIIMAFIHYTITNLETLTAYMGWSEQIYNWVATMGGTLNSIITASSFIQGLQPTTQWLIAWLVIAGFFLTGLVMLWKPKLAALFAIGLLGLELFLQLTTYNSVIIEYSVTNQVPIWELMTLPYIADLNLILLLVIAATTAVLCGAVYVLYKSWRRPLI